MRLIDADGLIKKAYRSEMWNRSTQAFDLFVVDAEDVEDAPTIDAVEVVRCKDCEAYGSSPYNHPRFGFCIVAAAHVDPEHYCAYGKRRKRRKKNENA